MKKPQLTKAGFARTYLLPALWLFAIPILGVAFVWYVNTDHPPVLSIGLVSLSCIALGVVSILVVLGCVAASFRSRDAQYWSFVAGWNFLRIASALQVLAQGYVAVMLSFWVTAFFFERFFVKLVLIAAVAALMAAASVIRAIFRKPVSDHDLEGALIEKSSSPALWERIEGLCARLGTEPPKQVVGGIDDNFFVTENPVKLGDRTLEGRTLFVSLSLLKRLAKTEADAILAHEMAHFSGGDTLYSKKIAPLLSRYGHYMVALHEGGLSRPVFHFMFFYWSLFQISLGRASRQRELRADAIAAEQTSPESMAHALYKVLAYSSYRGHVESGLFQRDRTHSQLNIAQSMAVGFSEYATSSRLTSDLQEDSEFPHPFDTHPSLSERLRNVGVSLPAEHVVDVVTSTSAQTWFSEIGDAEKIEGALWEAYQARFRDAHEESLAYRYLPSTPEERMHVERYFPRLAVANKEGQPALWFDCEELKHEDWPSAIRWEAITELKVEDETFRGKALYVHHKPSPEAKPTKLKFRIDKLERSEDEVTSAIGSYYARVLAAKEMAASAKADELATTAPS